MLSAAPGTIPLSGGKPWERQKKHPPEAKALVTHPSASSSPSIDGISPVHLRTNHIIFSSGTSVVVGSVRAGAELQLMPCHHRCRAEGRESSCLASGEKDAQENPFAPSKAHATGWDALSCWLHPLWHGKAAAVRMLAPPLQRSSPPLPQSSFQCFSQALISPVRQESTTLRRTNILRQSCHLDFTNSALASLILLFWVNTSHPKELLQLLLVQSGSRHNQDLILFHPQIPRLPRHV